jgi:predicted AAA+ superfamily ATPase
MRLLAVRVGSDFNASNIARELGVTSVTVSEWMSMLTTSYIAYPLRPYFSNASKRLTKMPKIYFYDTGLLCYLLGIENSDMLQSHPMRGAVFENYAMAELMKRQFNQAYDANIYYYRENSGREVDAVVIASSGTDLYEIKSGKTMHIEFADNMKVVADKIPNVTSSSVIFDGDTIASIAINVREI